MVSIIPGIETAPPERTETRSGFRASPKPRPVVSSSFVMFCADLVLESRRARSGGEKLHAGRAGDREPRGDRHTEIGHLGEVRPLAAQHGLHVPGAVGFAVAEEVSVALSGHAWRRETGNERVAWRGGPIHRTVARAFAQRDEDRRALDADDLTATVAKLHRDAGRGCRVFTGEAGVTEAIRPARNGLQHAVQRQVAERIDANELRDLVDRVVGGDQFFPIGRVDAVVARSDDGRDCSRACAPHAPRAANQRATSPRVVVPRTMESSTITTLLPASNSRTGLNFTFTLASRPACVGWMKVRPT
jgi:hypothetical protein